MMVRGSGRVHCFDKLSMSGFSLEPTSPHTLMLSLSKHHAQQTRRRMT